MSFALKLKELREERNLTQRQLATALNVGSGSVGMWESTKRMPPAKKLQKIADYFGVSIDYLLDTDLGGVQDMNTRIKGETLQLWLTKKKQLGYTNKQIAEIAQIPLSTIEQIMCGKVKSPRLDTVEAIERALGIKNNPVILDEVDLNDNYLVPLLGSVVAGVPIESQQDLEGYIYISFRPSEEYFALRVHGDSMKNAGILDSSVIVCHKQEIAESGEIVVAMLNGEHTVKRYKVHGNNIYLMPENPDFLPIPVTPTDSFLILGKVVEVRFAV